MDIAVRAAADLSAAFSATVFGTEPPSSLTCGDHETNQIGFFLNPFVEDSECAGADLILLGIMSVVIFALTWWGRWFIWEPIADLRMRNHKQFDPSMKKRFGVTLTSIVVHACSAFFVFKILTPTEWLWIPLSWCANIDEDEIDADFKFYYLLYLARYCSDSVSILFETRRKVRQFWSWSIGVSTLEYQQWLFCSPHRYCVYSPCRCAFVVQDQFLQMVYHHAGKFVND